MRWAARLLLADLNRQQVQRHAGDVPESLQSSVTPETSHRSADYTLAKNRFGMVQDLFEHAVLASLLVFGFFPWLEKALMPRVGAGDLGRAVFLLAALAAWEATSLPFGWWQTFRLEARYGFNRSTPGLWAADLAKGLVIQWAIALPVLLLLFKLVRALGSGWWLWGFGAVSLIQLVLMVAYPRFIMPLFNKFTALPEGALKEKLLALCARLKFPVRDLKVMDGSRRSSHSNAFFTGFGNFRRIVLFDTLVAQLDPAELEGVLAHEIGHSKKRHVTKQLAISLAGTFLLFWMLPQIQARPEIARAFGFGHSDLAVTLLLVFLLLGLATFWLSPLASALSRRYEYQADRYAAEEGTVGAGPLITALVKSQKENLGNLYPHPVVVFFYYSHPPLVQRLEKLNEVMSKQGA